MNKIKYLLFVLVTCLYACDQDNIFDTQEQLRNDVALIEQYIAENNINATAFENGLHIAIESVGTGNNPIWKYCCLSL